MADNSSPPVRALVAVAVYAVIAITAVLVLYALTPKETRPELLNRITIIIPVIISGIPGVLAWVSSRKTEQTLNGNLEPRIKQAAADALHETGVTKAVQAVPEAELSPSMPDRPPVT